MIASHIACSGDPWRDATISAEGLNVPSTADQPIGLGDGFHCSDLSTANGLADPIILGVQKRALASISKWVSEWKPTNVSVNGGQVPASNDGPTSTGGTKRAFRKQINAWFRGAGVA
jgi:hypothetical protein